MNYQEEQEFYWNLIHFDEVIHQKLPMIKEKYIEFYGEKHRTSIEKKFENLYMVAYNKPKVVENRVYSYLESVSKQLQDEFFEEISNATFSSKFNTNILTKNEENKKILFAVSNFLHKWSIPLEKIFTYIENRNENVETGKYLKREALQLINTFYSTNYTEEEFLQHFDAYKDDFVLLKSAYDKIIYRFNLETDKLKDKIDYYQDMSKTKSSIQQEENNNYLLGIRELLNKNDKEKLDNFTFNNFYNFEAYKILFNSDLSFPALIDDFYNHYDEILLNPTVTDEEIGFEKSKIDTYFKDETGNINYPSKEKLEQIIILKDAISNKIIDCMIRQDPIFMNYYDEISHLPLLNKNIALNRETILNDYTFVQPNVIEKENDLELFSILFISSNLMEEYIDQFLYHELNHVIETVLLDVEKKNIGFNTGMDLVVEEIKEGIDFDDTMDEEKRDFELLSEITNEYLSQEFHQYCLDTNFTVINTKSNSKVKGATSYERLKPFVENYYEHFKEDIKEARLDYNSSESFYSKVGYDNLKELNEVIRTYNEEFGGFAYYNLMDKIIAKESCKEVDRFYSLIDKSNQIYKNMLASEQAYKERCVKGV